MARRNKELGRARVVGTDRLGLVFQAGLSHIDDILQQDRIMMERRDAMLRKKHGLPLRPEDLQYVQP